MNRKIAILIMALIIVTPFIQDVTASKTVFITSDTIIDQENDVKMLNSIKNYIEEISNGELQVIVDNQAPAPGEGWRAIEVTSDISICLAASDAANYLQLGQASANSQKQIVFVNTGNYDLDNNSNYLRRAWDDNYSNSSFAGMRNPGTFLKNAGVYYVQPLKEFPSNGEKGNLNKYDENMNRYIAEKVVDIVNTHFNDTAILSDGFDLFIQKVLERHTCHSFYSSQSHGLSLKPKSDCNNILRHARTVNPDMQKPIRSFIFSKKFIFHL